MSDETKKKIVQWLNEHQDEIPEKKCWLKIELFEGGVKSVEIEAKLK